MIITIDIKTMVILIDNGHGIETPGKRSPDGRLLEWRYNREIASRIVASLREDGYNARLLVPEDDDVSLSRRCARCNAICRAEGKANVLLVSVHCNASAKPGWDTASGLGVYVSLNASERSKDFACRLFDEAGALGLKTRRQDGRKYHVQDLAICRDTTCAAVLTENYFMNCKGDVDFLLSPEGRKKIVAYHVAGIKKMME